MAVAGRPTRMDCAHQRSPDQVSQCGTHRTIERLNAGVAAFILTSGDLQGEEMAQIFVKALPAITRFLSKHKRPFIAKIARDGSVLMLFQGNRA